MRIAGRGVVGGACLLLALTGCSGSSGGGGSTSTGGASASVSASGGPDHLTIQGFAFHPANLSVAPGAVVTVTNADRTAHTVTATGSAKPFDTGTIAPGRTVTFTAPAGTGSHPYTCTIHPFMKGTLTIG